MQQREEFIKDWLCGDENFADLCRRYGIHRSKGYKWRDRFLREGIGGLVERSRAPHRHPNQTPEAICEALIELRRQHPRWGAAKLLELLARKEPTRSWPAPSTAHEILKRANLIDAPKRTRRPGEYTDTLRGYYGPNAVWGADFKGHFVLWNKSRCNPLTISDLCSRFLLRCSALSNSDTKQSQEVFRRAFIEFGLPEVIRSDNGPPFSSTSGLSELSVWWIKLGIRPERITRGCPTENAIHERIHRTMDDEDATVPQDDLDQQQRRFDRFRKTYNEVRPHLALAMKAPAEVYHRSERLFPRKLRSPEYPPDYHVLRVSEGGRIHFAGHDIYLSRLIATEPVGLRDTASATEVWYGPQLLGTLNTRGELRRGFPTKRTGTSRVPTTPEESLESD